MALALTDTAIVIGIMALIGLLGYLMDRQGQVKNAVKTEMETEAEPLRVGKVK
jgi:hypothetical protein